MINNTLQLAEQQLFEVIDDVADKFNDRAVKMMFLRWATKKAGMQYDQYKLEDALKAN